MSVLGYVPIVLFCFAIYSLQNAVQAHLDTGASLTARVKMVPRVTSSRDLVLMAVLKVDGALAACWVSV